MNQGCSQSALAMPPLASMSCSFAACICELTRALLILSGLPHQLADVAAIFQAMKVKVVEGSLLYVR